MYESVSAGLRDFYILAGTGAATLVGLLFVGLSLHLRTVLTVAEVRSVARVTLANFAAVLFVSLFLVINEDQDSAGLQLVGLGVISIAVTAPSLVAAVRSGPTGRLLERGNRVRLLLRFGLSTLSYVAIIAAGVCLLVSLVAAFEQVIVVAILVLLVVSLRNTWDLLVTVGDATMRNGKDRAD